MLQDKVTVRLNQQQWELVDRTVAQGAASDRANLFRMALREYWQRHLADREPGNDARAG